MGNAKSKSWQKFNARLREKKIEKSAKKGKTADAVNKLEKKWGSNIVGKDMRKLSKEYDKKLSKEKSYKKKSSKNNSRERLIIKKLEKAKDTKSVANKLKNKYGTKVLEKALSKLSKNLSSKSKKGNSIPNIIKKVADQRGLGKYANDLVKIVSAESNFDPNAKNPTSSAIGIFQLIKAHGSEEDRKDPEKATNIALDLVERRLKRGQDPFADWNASRNVWGKMSDEEIAERTGFGKGGGGDDLSSEGATYATNYPGVVYDAPSDPSGAASPTGSYSSPTVAYKSSSGQYYSVSTSTGEKTKVSKAEAKKLEKIDEKEYKEIKSLTSKSMSKALNRDQLAALKQLRPDVANHPHYGKNADTLLEWWKKNGSKESGLLDKVNQYVSNTGGSVGGLSSASYALANDPNYNSLPDDLKKVAAYFENVGMASNTEQGTRLINALKQAGDQSDPYFKQLFRIAEDTMIRTSDSYKASFGTDEERLTKRMTEIQEDLAKNKDYLTLEMQSDLNRVAMQYKINVEQTQGTMANAGLTDSSIKQQAEARLAESNKDLVESTQRQYSKKIADLETESQRGSTEAKRQLDELKRTYGENITRIGREMETTWGTTGMPGLAGYAPLGNVTGEMYENKIQDVMQRAGTLLGESNMNSLNLNL